MKLSTRVRYGMRAMIELAKQKGGKPVSLRAMAKSQNVSSKYLEQMAATMRRAGLIESIRGAEGGYRLAKPAEEITALDIYESLDVAGDPESCFKPACSRKEYCAVQDMWGEMFEAMRKVLASKTLKQL